MRISDWSSDVCSSDLLANARNLDVLLERAKPGALRDRIAASREAAYDAVGEVLASARVRALMLDLAEWAASGDWQGAPDTMTAPDQPARDFAISALDRFRRQVKRDGRDLAHIEDEARHEVRTDAKKLRHSAELFQIGNASGSDTK